MANGNDEKWEQKFALLEQFYREYGRFPMQKDDYHGVKLGLWCANQRRDVVNGKCLPERYAKLHSIGFLQNRTHDVRWEQNFQILQQFVAAYGRFPTEQDVYQGVNIGKWCSNQKLHAQLPDYPKYRIQKLTNIGFFDTTRTARWEQHYAMLERFVAEHGHLPKRNEVYEGFQLGAWCAEQKRKAADDGYPLHRVERLQQIGLLNGDSRMLSWEQSFALLEQYVAEHHKFPVAKEQYQGYNLGNWCEAQKFLARHTAYPAEHMQKLEEIGIFSTTRDAKWERQYALVEEFVAEHGRLPKQKESYRGERIGLWCTMQKQRSKKDGYPAERMVKLKQIGLVN